MLTFCLGSTYRILEGASVRSDSANGQKLKVSLNRHRTLLWTTDVDPNADRAQVRFTSHLFRQDLELAAGPSGSAVRVPSDVSIWPPAALFDAVYASAVVRHFGFALTEISEKWGDVFYPDPADADKEDSSRRSRQRRYEKRGIHDAIDPHDVVMMYRFQAMEPEKVRAYLKGCEELAAAGERKGLEEKVNSWRESLAPLTAIDTD